MGSNPNETERPCDGSPTVNVPPVTVPTGFVTLIGPVVAPVGTVVAICESDVTENTAETPLNFTPVTPVKFEPLSVTADPDWVDRRRERREHRQSDDEVRRADTGGLIDVVTVILPEVAPAGTVAVICVGEFTDNDRGSREVELDARRSAEVRPGDRHDASPPRCRTSG